MPRLTAAERAELKDRYLSRYFSHVLRTYGLTREEWQELFKAQGGRCACCRRPFRLKIGGSGNGRMPAVDHNHLTGEVRGLLCGGSFNANTCNRLIGFHKDDPEFFRRVAGYLENPPARAVLIRMRGGDQ